MPISEDEDREERQLRIDQMTVNIEKMRFDIQESRDRVERDQARSERDQKWETRKFVVSAILATAAAVGAGVGIGNLIWAHQPPSVALSQFPPGTVITIPATAGK
jgi:hypothetical protein